MAKANPFRFSTKYQDDETDLVYYGYRYYSASTGRWRSQAPLQEIGFDPTASNLKQFNRSEGEMARLSLAAYPAFANLVALTAGFGDANSSPDGGRQNNAGSSNSPNLYALNDNDAIDGVDYLGLYHFMDWYKCPPTTCAKYVCIMKFDSPRRVPANWPKLAACLKKERGAMLDACYLGFSATFVAHCQACLRCYVDYW